MTTPRVSRLPNGLTVVTSEMPHMASVSLGIWVGVGGRFEPSKLSGVSHFIEHLLFKGTRRRTAKQISQDVEGIGGYLNAFTSEEFTCFYSKARHDRIEELLDVLTDMFLESTFQPVEIGKERKVIKDELAMYLDQPHHHVQELLNETLWPEHPLGRSITGSVQTLDRMTRSDLTEFRQRNYVAESTLIAAAGRLSHEKLVRAVTRIAKRFSRGSRPKFTPVTAAPAGPRLRLFSKETEQTHLALGLRTCSRHDPRRYALRLLNTVLGENMSSRLFQVLREDRGLAYSIGSSFALFDDTGVLIISGGVETEKLGEAIRLIAREIKRLTQHPVGSAELRRAKDYAIGQIDLGLEGTENQMMWLGEQLLSYGAIARIEQVKRKVLAVTAEEIRRGAREFLRPERASLALVSSLKRDRGLNRLLRF